MNESAVVELRVHGVAGTPPDELLDRALVMRVAGDNRAGFYRPALADESTDDPPGGVPGSGPLLEGYSWGGLTSGAAARAFWLLLLPFTFANVAPRLRPPGPSRLFWWLSRVFALGLTALMMHTATGIGAGEIGWRCGVLPAGGCPGLPTVVDTFVRAAAPGERLLIGSILPALLLVVLLVLGRSTAGRYERAQADPRAAYSGDDPGNDPDVPPLTHPDLWRGEHLVRRLRRLHMLVAAAVCVASIALPAYVRDGGPVGWFGAGVLACCAIAVVGTLVLLACRSVTSRKPTAGAAAGLADRAHQPAIALGLLAVAYLLIPRSGWLPAGGLPGYNEFSVLLFGFLVVIALLLTASIALMWRAAKIPEGQPKPALGGYGTVFLTAAGLLIGAGFSAGVTIYAGAFLRTGSVRPGFDEVQRALVALGTAPASRTASLTFALMLAWLVVVVLVGLAIVAYRMIWPAKWTYGQRLLNQQYPEAHRTATRDEQILRAFWIGRIADTAGRWIGAVLLPWMVLAAAAIGFSMAALFSADAARFLVAVLDRTSSLSALGAYGTVLALLLLVGLGAAAFKARKTRRIVGVLWDVGAFWPRAAHPLAAPCYAERTVPDLVQRLRWYAAGAPAGNRVAEERVPVVVSGHSQGGVITAAVVLQLDRPVRDQVAFLAVGTVLRRIYARYFPAYFDMPALDAVAARLTGSSGRRLRSLWRTTDPVGGAIGTGPRDSDPPAPAGSPLVDADRQLTDPEYAASPGDPVSPPILAHNDYPADPVYHTELAELAHQLPNQPPRPERRLRLIH